MRVTMRVVLSLVLVVSACKNETPDRATPSAAFHTDSVGERTETFVDTSREAGGRPRELRTTIWFPTSGGAVATGRHPVVIFSHGLGAFPDAYEDLIRPWAADGFVVAAPMYPLTNGGVSAQPRDLVNQPADVSFVLDELAAINADEDDDLHNALDMEHVAAVGHSLGGMTTVGLMSTCCAENRLDAAVVYAGSGYGFERAGLVDEPPPVLFIHGDRDTTVPMSGARSVYDDVERERAFITLLDGDHVTPFFGGSDPHAELVAETTLSFLRWRLLGDSDALEELRELARTGDHVDFDDDLRLSSS